MIAERGAGVQDGEGAASFAGGWLTIDLAAVVANYRAVQAAAAPSRVAAVVKADAYGLGAAPVAAALARAGCHDFFVADLAEALGLRAGLGGDPDIYVLNGLFPGSEAAAQAAAIIPVLNSREQVRRWADLAKATAARLPAVVQVDTGMSRLGMDAEDVAWLAGAAALADLDVRYLMSHLACADADDGAVSALQRAEFERLAAMLPPWPRTLANSAAALTDPQAHGDLVRAGIALYGAVSGEGLRPVVTLSGRVLQTRTLRRGAGVGYGMTYRAKGAERIATIAVGYADGWPRALGNRGAAWFGGVRLPIIGQVSMDSMMIDVSALPSDALGLGDAVELIGPHQTLADVADLAGTIPYEILTRLGHRYARSYRAEPGELIAAVRA